MSNRLLFFVAVALLGYGLLYLMAQRSFFHPMRHPQGNWSLQKSLPFEDAHFTASDGIRLHGWFLRNDASPLVTLHLHGNAGNITHRAHVAAHVSAAGSSALLLDYRGYGRSEGSPSEEGLYRDAEAAYRWLLSKNYSPEKIIVHGESIGAAVAVELASRFAHAGLILEAPFSSARDVAARALPFIGPTLVSGFDSVPRIRNIRRPVLFIHGDADDIIHPSLGRKLFDAANEPKELWTLAGAGHNDLFIKAGGQYAQRLDRFYASLQ